MTEEKNAAGRTTKDDDMGAATDNAEVDNGGSKKDVKHALTPEDVLLVLANGTQDDRFVADVEFSKMISKISKIQRNVKAAVTKCGLSPNAAMSVYDAIENYDTLVAVLMVKISGLNSELSYARKKSMECNAQVETSVGHARMQTPAANGNKVKSVAPLMKKPVETWSSVVSSKDPNIAAKPIAEKPVKEVEPELGDPEPEVREQERGGDSNRTPLNSDMWQVVQYKKSMKTGLEVKKNQRTRPKVTIFHVDTWISPDEFMNELYERNLKDSISPAAFKEAVHLETKPWSNTEKEFVNLTIEVDDKVKALLDDLDWVYTKWSSFRCRSVVMRFN